MLYRFEEKEIMNMINKQLTCFYSISTLEMGVLQSYFEPVMNRVSACFSENSNKYYHRSIDGVCQTFFDPLHTCQWFVFLSMYANTIWKWSIVR